MDKKTYIGSYKGVRCYGVGCMIGNNWYGDYYCTKQKNGRNYKVKESITKSVDALKTYIREHIKELKEV